MLSNQNIQGIKSSKGSVRVGNFILEDNRITSASNDENIQGISSEFDIEVLGTVSFQRNEIISSYQQILNEIQSETFNLFPTQQEREIIDQLILFLGSRELFINYRQSIINHLIEIYCQFSSKKYRKFSMTQSMMGITSKIVSATPCSSIATTSMGIVGDISLLAGTIIQNKDLEKCIERFQSITEKDSENLALFYVSYQALSQLIFSHDQKSIQIQQIIDILHLERVSQNNFYNNYEIYRTGGIWKSNFSNSTSENLKEFIEKLDSNLKEIRSNFELQRSQILDQEWFRILQKNSNLLTEVNLEEKVVSVI